MHEPQLPPLTETQLDLLRRFASFEAGIEDLSRVLAGEFDFNVRHALSSAGAAQKRNATGRFRLPEPGIVITREHIANALERRRFDLVSERDLVEWATILLVNDAYVLDPTDEDLIAEWLNDISVNLNAN
jgi:aspartate/methionine/tyrosine aminotransferase